MTNSEGLRRFKKEVKQHEKFVDEKNIEIDKANMQIVNLNNKIAKLNERIKRHSESINKRKYPSWTDILLSIRDDMERVSGMKFKASGHVFGLNCRTYIELSDDSGNSYNLIVLPKNEFSDEFYLAYETGERTNRYPAGSLGAINGMNNLTAPLPDTAEELFEIMKKKSVR